MREYTEPAITIYEFDKEEILTVSSGLTNGGEGNSDNPLEWASIFQ